MVKKSAAPASGNVLEEIKDKLSKKILKVYEKSPRRTYSDLKPADIPTPAAFISRDKIIRHRTHLDRKNPEIESLTSIIRGAEWIEREIHELLGVNFRNHPNLKKLLLPDDWPKNKYPLRRDYRG